MGSPTKFTLSLARGGFAGHFISDPSSLRIAQPAIKPPILSFAICSPVNISTTPEAFFALNDWSHQRSYPYGYVNDKRFFEEFEFLAFWKTKT